MAQAEPLAGAISYERCAVCSVMGADLPVPKHAQRFACCKPCLAKAINQGLPTSAVPMPQPVGTDLYAVFYRCAPLDPEHLVDAALWVAMDGRADAAGRVAPLHAAMVDYNRTRGGPYSHLPLPLDPTLYNVHATYARHYATLALRDINEAKGAAATEESVLQGVRAARTTGGESDARAHALALWLTYGVFWRHYLHEYDWHMWCALSAADVARVAQSRPCDPPPPQPTTRAMVTADTFAALRRLQVAVKAAVDMLFNQMRFSKDMIQAYLVEGLFADVAPAAFDTRPEDAPESALEADTVLEVKEARGLLQLAQAGGGGEAAAEQRFIASVADSHASILSWARARFDRTVNRVKGFTSRIGYDVVTLADRLYQLAIANKCQNGATARAYGLVVSPLNTSAYLADSAPKDKWFANQYGDAFERAAAGLDVALWRKDWQETVAAGAQLARRVAERNVQIRDYTCVNSKTAALQPARWQQLPADIAAQVVAMGRYMYMTDQSSGVKADARRKRVKDDIVFLVKELSRKVGTDDMAVLLGAAAPVLPPRAPALPAAPSAPSV